MSLAIGIAALGVAGVLSSVTAPRVTLRSSLRERRPDLFVDSLGTLGAVESNPVFKKVSSCSTYQGGATGAVAGLAFGDCSYDEAVASAKEACKQYDGLDGGICEQSVKVVEVGKKIVDAVQKLKFW